jgi:AcrR family transcriptional regulator
MAKRKSTKRIRLAAEDREREIVRGAAAFFAEVGFDGGTRECAARLGITQGLLYRYFPTKDRLIDRIYQEVYLSNWNPRWESRLCDRSAPLEKRLTEFYTDYARAILTYEWVRLFLFAGLKGLDFNARYIDFLRGAVFEPVVLELRADSGIAASLPIEKTEIELVWGLHASIFYLGVRQWVYGMAPAADIAKDTAQRVHAFLRGARAALQDMPRSAAAKRARV